MNSWQNLSLNEKHTILENIAKERKTLGIIVEKDWWVSTCLRALFHSSLKDQLVFKGGTSLSKGWELINRFSEDIDISIAHSFFDIEPKNRTQIKKLRQKANDKAKEFASELEVQLKRLGIENFYVEIPDQISSDKDPLVIDVNYESVTEKENIPLDLEYIKDKIIIEISCSALHEPSMNININSWIASRYPEYFIDEPNFEVKVANPSRTFLEKVFLLHEEFQREEIRSFRMSRHLYDIMKMINTSHMEDALKNIEMYINIVKHRSFFNRVGNVNYELHNPHYINIIPPESVIEDYKKDYERMQQHFYDSPPSFETLIGTLRDFLKKLNSINIEDFSGKIKEL